MEDEEVDVQLQALKSFKKLIWRHYPETLCKKIEILDCFKKLLKRYQDTGVTPAVIKEYFSKMLPKFILKCEDLNKDSEAPQLIIDYLKPFPNSEAFVGYAIQSLKGTSYIFSMN